jgi:ribonuclease HI
MNLSIYTDAGARGNPGPAAIAILIFQDSRLVKQHGEYIGPATNNQAEYHAVIKALELARSLGAEQLKVFTDSELICRQIKGSYKIKNQGLKPLHEKVKALEKGLRVEWGSVPRENPNIRRADRLVNSVLDSQARETGGPQPRLSLYKSREQ